LEQMQNIGQPLVSKSTSEITSPGQGLDLSSLIMLLLFSGMFGGGQQAGLPGMGATGFGGAGAGAFGSLTPGGFGNILGQ